MLEQREQISAEHVETQFVLRSQRHGLSMATSVKGNQSNPGRRLEQTKRLCHIRAQAMLEDERKTGSFVAIKKRDPVVRELRHTPSLRLGEPAGNRFWVS